jgi:ADP-heptose:LPS heptosyltransferase
MGIGDEIMALGHAQKVYKDVHTPICIINKDGAIRWHSIWDGAPQVTNREGYRIVNGPGSRPYIQYPFTIAQGQRFTGWKAKDHVATLYLTPRELAFGDGLEDYVLIEPNLHPQSNQNKQWKQWQELIYLTPDVKYLQVGPKRTHLLRGVMHIETPTFRDACGVINAVKACVLPEGGLHHAAGALRKKAVVIFGGHISTETTGYDWHINLGTTEPCGKWTPCRHCEKIMNQITPELVAEKLRSIL